MHVVASVDPRTGGPAVSVPTVARHQAQLGARVLLACARGGVPGELRKDRALRLACWKSAGLRGFAGDGRSVIDRAARHVSVIHNHGLWMGCNTWARVAAQRNGLPLIVSPRGMLEGWSLGHSSWKKKLAVPLYEGANLEAAAVLHATSDGEAESIRQFGLTQPIAVVPNGIELPAYSARSERGSKRRVALFLSRLHRKKGIEELIAAWSALTPQGWELWIAGDGDPAFVARLREQARQSGAPIRFLGFVEGAERERTFAAADLFLLPSYSENFGMVVGEALGRGIPVLTTSATPWDFLERDDAGWIARPGLKGLQEKLALALDHSAEDLRRKGARGRELVLRKYSWEAAAAQLLGVAEWLCGQRNTPDCVRVD